MRATSHAIVFRPASQQPATRTAAVAGVASLLALGLVVRGLVAGVTFASFASYVTAGLLLGAAALAGYWALAIANLRYEVTGGTLTVVWGLTRQVVPLAAVERIVRGRNLGLPQVRGLSLPGWNCHVGRAAVPRLGRVLVYSTHRSPGELLYLVTEREVYGLSPTDTQGLIRALQQAATVDPGSPVRQEVTRLWPASMPIWQDRVALVAVAFGAVVALAAAAIVFARYTGTTPVTVLPFPDGDHLGNKRELLGMPLLAVTLLLLNVIIGFSLHRTLRAVAYVFLLGGVFVQSLLLVAALTAA